jgi:two-component system cell cycle response regulator DivK
MTKALLVEDNENNRYLFSILLSHAGFTVSTADNGRSGLERALAEKPDVILLDIQMAEMDGYEVVGHLKNDPALSHIPVIGVSSFAMPGDRARAIDAGFAGYIEKPVDPERFGATVLQMLATARGAA